MIGRRMLVGAGVVAVAALCLAGLWAGQRALIYHPQTGGPVPPAADVLPGARDVTLRTADGLELGAWFVPGRGPGADGTVVLVANGNAGDRSVRAPLAAALAARGLSVLLFDYRGYGGNPGTPTEDGLALDVRAARTWLVDELGAQRIVYYGESLGAAVVTELATEHPPVGLLLRSPFTELADVGRLHYPFLPVRLLLRERYPVAEGLRRISVPTTVVYGSADRMVPPELSRAAAAAAAGPVRLVEVTGADHNDPVLLTGRELIDAVVAVAR